MNETVLFTDPEQVTDLSVQQRYSFIISWSSYIIILVEWNRLTEEVENSRIVAVSYHVSFL
jgi:hypothetical protein